MSKTFREELRAARGPATVDVDEQLRERVLQAAFASDGPAAAPARRRWRGRSLPLIAAGVFGLAGVATAAGLVVSQASKDQSAELAGQPQVGGGGAGTGGAELQREVQRLRAMTPYPPGVADEIPVTALEGVAAGSVRVVVEQRANCLWQRYWAQSAAAGDERGMADAALILRQSADWPTFRADGGEGRATALQTAAQAAGGAENLAAFEGRMAGQCAGVLGTPTP